MRIGLCSKYIIFAMIPFFFSLFFPPPSHHPSPLSIYISLSFCPPPTISLSGRLKSVDISLPVTLSLGHAVHTILRSCGLLDRISDETRARLLLAEQPESPVSISWGSGHVFKDLNLEKWEDMFEGDSRDKRRPLLLDEWLKEYAPVARVANEQSQPIREENVELLRELCACFGVGGVHCSTGWTATTLRGYLCGLRSVLEREGEVWREVVEGWRRGGMCVGRRGGGGGGVVREGGWSEGVGEGGGPVVVMGHGCGVDVQGRICFNCEGTPQQWARVSECVCVCTRAHVRACVCDFPGSNLAVQCYYNQQLRGRANTKTVSRPSALNKSQWPYATFDLKTPRKFKGCIHQEQSLGIRVCAVCGCGCELAACPISTCSP